MRDYRKLEVWGKAHDLTLRIYRETLKFPKDELYGLVSQIRRSAVSVPANIAEGYGRASEPEFARYLGISIGSSSELSYHLLLAKDLGYLSEEVFRLLAGDLAEIQSMLSGLKLKVDRD